MINKFQQGGQMNEEQQAFTAFLIKVLEPEDEADFENKVSQLSEDDLKEFYKQFKSMNSQISMAKLGAKLNYVQTLRGTCPEGYEIEKFLAGGCVKCRKKARANAADVFKGACGGKTKKRISKNQNGGKTNKSNDTIHPNGTVYNISKTNKSNVTPNDTIHHNGTVYNISKKQLPYKKMDKETYRKLPDAKKSDVDLKDQARGVPAEAAAAKNNKVKKNCSGGGIKKRISKS